VLAFAKLLVCDAEVYLDELLTAVAARRQGLGAHIIAKFNAMLANVVQHSRLQVAKDNRAGFEPPEVPGLYYRCGYKGWKPSAAVAEAVGEPDDGYKYMRRTPKIVAKQAAKEAAKNPLAATRTFWCSAASSIAGVTFDHVEADEDPEISASAASAPAPEEPPHGGDPAEGGATPMDTGNADLDGDEQLDTDDPDYEPGDPESCEPTLHDDEDPSVFDGLLQPLAKAAKGVASSYGANSMVDVVQMLVLGPPTPAPPPHLPSVPIDVRPSRSAAVQRRLRPRLGMLADPLLEVHVRRREVDERAQGLQSRHELHRAAARARWMEEERGRDDAETAIRAKRLLCARLVLQR